VDPGPEVLPNLSPYYNGRIELAGRGPCPSPSIVAQTGYYLSDLSCPIGPQTWRSALRSTHSAVAAADHVASAGGMAYALCRPSGHHAHRDRAGGFCYLNSSAAAASRLLQTWSKVAVLDVDAHHGDGTQNIFYQRGDVMTVSLHADPAGYYPFYTGYAHERGYGAGEGCNLNLPLPHGSGNDSFLRALDTALAALTGYAPQAVVLALGFDTYKDDPISVLKLDIDAYRDIGARVASLGLPTVIVQEGGYMVEAIGPALDAFLQGAGQAAA
jgi:acetoin utilization deacetylase AcuC-like enzyme